ncbi:GGDEF domain-containing protein [Pseudoalteromonas denitrificans]|uniref:diguanylate cyclase n=1 Tax=Pseudoalteromonas denitrificans DSM 6059 TaxID=1123010 RepID=A0A1I1HAD3_9GAMM|nr:GGDEF domain-containing protein [Pseudoalteromonas denitrificans]SFC20562.1 diguanylate cyclase (GGDEF) domain-containing protein [Pseudoalteromonas denitrificans DSM 6059]
MENVHVLTQSASSRGEYLPTTADYYRPLNDENIQSLVSQLQKTLELTKLINIFSLEATKLFPISGLQFHSTDGVIEMSGSKHQGKAFAFDLEVESERLGQLVYFSQKPISIFIKEKLQLLHNVLAYPLRNALMFYRVKKLATKDTLTGLSNRSHFNDYLNKKLDRCRRHHRRFGLMLLDLDNFKQVNDTHGHLLGDQVLVQFSALLMQSIRGIDTVFRFGGDEFSILIDDNQEGVCNIIADRIQRLVHKDALLAKHNVTTSIGFTLAKVKDDQISVFERSDKALYQAKGAGRDCFKIL